MASDTPAPQDADTGASAPSEQPPMPRPDDDLLSRLEVVESQPLASRAAAYEAVHEDLARRLEHLP